VQTGPRIIVMLAWGYVDQIKGMKLTNGEVTLLPYPAGGNGLVLRDVRTTPWGNDSQPNLQITGSNCIIMGLRIYKAFSDVFANNGEAARLQSNWADWALGNGDGLGISDGSTIPDLLFVTNCNVAFTHDDNQVSATNSTLQYCIYSDAIHHGYHTKTMEPPPNNNPLDHGYPLLLWYDTSNFSLHHCLITNGAQRFPKLHVKGRTEASNLLGYNNVWPGALMLDTNHASTPPEINFTRCFNKWGARTRANNKPYYLWFKKDDNGAPTPQYFLDQNEDMDANATRLVARAGDQWANVKYDSKTGEPMNRGVLEATTRFDTPSLWESDVVSTYQSVMNYAGYAFTLDPSTGLLRDMRDPYHKALLQRIQLDTDQANGVSGIQFRDGSGDYVNNTNDYGWPIIPTGSITEAQFWSEYESLAAQQEAQYAEDWGGRSRANERLAIGPYNALKLEYFLWSKLLLPQSMTWSTIPGGPT